MQAYTQASHPCEMCTTQWKTKLPILIGFFLFPIIIFESCGECLDNASIPVCVQLICSRDWKENSRQIKGYAENTATSTV